MKTYVRLCYCLVQICLEWVSDNTYRENQKHTLYVQQRLSQNGTVYDLMLKKAVQPDMPQMTI